jgi:hypothetical protein
MGRSIGVQWLGASNRHAQRSHRPDPRRTGDGLRVVRLAVANYEATSRPPEAILRQELVASEGVELRQCAIYGVRAGQVC